MTGTRTFQARPLLPWDRDAALVLASSAGVHGVYVTNHLQAPDSAGTDAAEVLALWGQEQLVGLCWFGGRGNLVVIEREPLPPDAVADAIGKCLWSWRIVLGRPAVVKALAMREAVRPLVHREQVYYAAAPDDMPAALVRDDIRRAERADLGALVDAALRLNESDLQVEARRVNRAWLKEALLGRILEGSTHVLGPVGRPLSKLDIGSQGAAGLVLEGVFTFAEARGQGLAAGLVATIGREVGRGLPTVCLHVAATNASARAAYERAGMREAARCNLLLRG